MTDEVSPGKDRIGRWIVNFGSEELIKRAQSRQASVDGGDGMALLLAVDNISVHISNSDGDGLLIRPGEENPQIAGVVAVRAGMRVLPPQVLLKLFNFGEHFYLLMVRYVRTGIGSKLILPPEGICRLRLLVRRDDAVIYLAK